MKKIAPFMIAAVAVTSFAGCTAETGSTQEMTAEDNAALCANPEGTNAAIAALATAIGQELHRWQLLTDFYEFRGTYNQLQLGLTSAGKNACGGSCPMVENILALQDARMDQMVVFNGTRLSSWSFASRLTTGYDNMRACTQGGWCPFPAHVLGWTPSGYDGVTTSPGACDTVFTFTVNKPAAQNHAALSPSEIQQLSNALLFTMGNGPNPYIAFNAGDSTVSIDPTGQLNPPGQMTGSDICQKFSMTNLNGTPCTCAARGVYSNGHLQNTQPATPKIYYCTN